MPYRQQPGLEEMRLLHGHDERTSVDGLLFATRVLYDVVVNYTNCQLQIDNTVKITERETQ